MFKNLAGQKLTVYVWDSTTGLPKTGDAANLTAYRDLDDGGVTVLTDTSATEKDATNAKGYYIFDLSQAETNGDKILFSCKSSTANMVCVACPPVVQTLPTTGILAPATAGRTLVVDASGLADANTVKVGPSGSGTAQTAGDIYGYLTTNLGALGASLSAIPKTGFKLASDGLASVTAWTVAITGNITGNLSGSVGSVTAGVTLAASAVQAIWDAATSALTTAGSIGKAILDNWSTILGRLTSARAGYLDNLNVGGVVASHADIVAINTSSSKHIILTTVGQYERPESSSTVYTVEARTFAADTGAAVNADSTPTLTATGQTSGSLAANLGSVTNPATGVYRATYTVASNATPEPIRFDVSATISSSTFTLSCYTQVVDEVSATWTSTNASNLTAIFNKLPANGMADETLLLAAIGTPAQASVLAADVAALPAAVRDVSNSSPAAGSLGEAVRGADAKAAALQITIGTPADLGSGATVAGNLTDIEADTANLATLYTASSDLQKDDANTTDRWRAKFAINGAAAAGVTAATIQVIKPDGTNLIASTAMTQDASTGYWHYYATTTARITAGLLYGVQYTFTDGSGTHTCYPLVIGRDST